MLEFLDHLLTVFHTAFILFVLSGWIWKKTRLLHFWTALLTCASWFLLGLFKGIGYCPLTDWQWEVKRKLGETELPNSFIKYLLDGMTSSSWDPATVDLITAVLGLFALTLSLWLQIRLRSSS